MTAYTSVRNAIRRAQNEQEPDTLWSDAALHMWAGYVAGLRHAALLTAEETFDLLREEIGLSEEMEEYALYVQETGIEDATDLVAFSRPALQAA